MFLSFEYSKRVFLFYNGYTESPFSHVPKSNVDQSMSPNELRHHYSKRKGHNRWPEAARFSGVNEHSWEWTYCSCENLTHLRVGFLWHTIIWMLVKTPWLHQGVQEQLVRLWWQYGTSLVTFLWSSENSWIVITKEKHPLMHLKLFKQSTSFLLEWS